ncbi:MAG: ABC transporter permease [Acidobacteria bacterium]|nr:ABC transporter permease [Acidobacteriota bacterium]MCA1640414.1 ABC transporter permease [Acidobacteriota bacterium]
MSTTSSNSAGALEPSIDNTPASPPVRTTPNDPPAHALPDEPLVTIQPSKPWSALDLGDLWAYRELLYFLTWRDLKVRYKQTLLGVAWVVLQPLMITLIFTVFLGMLVRVPSDGFPYALFAYAGLLPWMFFSSAVTASANSLVANAHLITKVYFPRLIVPTAAVAGRLVDFAIAFVILAGLLVYYRVGLTWNVLMLLPLVSLTMLLALGCGMLLSALNVKYRDIGVALPVLIQLWMYVSPVVYPPGLVFAKLGRWGWLYSLNPLVGIIDGFRVALLGGTFNRFALAVSTAVTLVLLVYSAFMFRRVEKGFADVI